MKTYDQRRRWIINYLLERRNGDPCVDILNKYFVDEYLAFTEAKIGLMPFGADKCQLLARDLQRMHRECVLRRHTNGLQGMAGMGFPRWVYVYELNPRFKEIYEHSPTPSSDRKEDNY